MPPTLWHVRKGDILDETADVLVCSANPFLTLSGGVGGALLLRYGPAVQSELTNYLKQIGRKHVDPGTVVIVKPTGTPYRAIIHAVAVNAFYESSAALVRSLVRSSLLAAAESGARTVALTALATGYGKLTMDEFAHSLVDVVAEDFTPVQEVTVIVRGADDAQVVNNVVPTIRLV